MTAQRPSLRMTRKNLFYHPVAQLSPTLQTVRQLVLAKCVAVIGAELKDARLTEMTGQTATQLADRRVGQTTSRLRVVFMH